MKHQPYQHLTLEQRIEIQECLSHGMTIQPIGKRIGKDATTTSREVKQHILIRQLGTTLTAKDGTLVNKPCELLLKPPFVCNPCKHFHHSCAFSKHVYSAKDANKAYESVFKTARELQLELLQCFNAARVDELSLDHFEV